MWMVSCHRENEAAEARAIMQAMHAFQTNPQLLDEARRDLPATLDRMGLSGIARHAVAAAVALSVGGVFLTPGTSITFWSA
jgi:hypothetical protein